MKKCKGCGRKNEERDQTFYTFYTLSRLNDDSHMRTSIDKDLYCDTCKKILKI